MRASCAPVRFWINTSVLRVVIRCAGPTAPWVSGGIPALLSSRDGNMAVGAGDSGGGGVGPAGRGMPPICPGPGSGARAPARFWPASTGRSWGTGMGAGATRGPAAALPAFTALSRSATRTTDILSAWPTDRVMPPLFGTGACASRGASWQPHSAPAPSIVKTTATFEEPVVLVLMGVFYPPDLQQ